MPADDTQRFGNEPLKKLRFIRSELALGFYVETFFVPEITLSNPKESQKHTTSRFVMGLIIKKQHLFWVRISRYYTIVFTFLKSLRGVPFSVLLTICHE